jgi:hypothetical protein
VRQPTACRVLALAVVCAAAGAGPCAAQVEASLEMAASFVKYDGYLASGAAALTPSVAWQSPRAALAARGTFLVFESGNTSVQGLLTAGAFSPPLGPMRVEAAAEAGASSYTTFARFSHGLARLRAHMLGSRWGAWAGPLAGTISRGGGPRGASGVAAGWWWRSPIGALQVSWTRVAVGDTAYSDLEGRARWRRGAFDVEGSAGVRVASRGGGSGVYGDVSAALRLSEWMGLLVATGNYPSDPVRGSIPGRFVTVGLRLAPKQTPRVAVVPQIAPPSAPVTGESAAPLDGAHVAVEQLDGLPILVVHVTGARRVEVMGDFTDWQPVALAAAGKGRFQYALSLPAGMLRFNVRVDGGPWGVPAGAGVAPDEFGSNVGVLVVP